MAVVIRSLEDDDLEALIEFSLEAWALMQTATDWIKAQGVELAVAATGGDPGHAPARALYERLGFTPLPLVRYYRTL